MKGISIRKIVEKVLKVLVSGFLIAFLLHRIGLDRLGVQLSHVHAFWLISAVFVFLASHLLGSYQWTLLLHADSIKLPWTRALQFYFVGLFFNNFLISGLGGDLFRIVDVRRYSQKGAAAVSSVFLDRFMGLLVLSGLALLVSPVISILWGFPARFQLILLIFSMGWVLVLLILFNRRFARFLTWGVRRLMPQEFAIKARTVYNHIHEFGRKRKLFLTVVLISVVVQSLRVLTHYLLARSFGISLPIMYFFLIIPLIAITASLPVSLGGLGVRENVGVMLFGLVGMAEIQAFSVEFLAYLVAIFCSLPGGLLFIIRKKTEPENNPL